ncbi:VrtR2 [Penicillium canariense]|uniref:VrtR2 n=1 Tax=Penicillium canariense TaxID=189055 RepID=A0A9W9LFX5_9EURO|nr:VrtR2 [Penicillium canariense]KAJ5153189.1 VrtR2 [Penicillium canariense]
MAVWTLIAVAVRSARSLGLHQDRGDSNTIGESFFDQQTRKRLWLIICLIDIQSSVARLSEPLVDYREAVSALAHVQHINDSDFDPTTTTPVTDREGLTDTTFALINYQVELAGSQLILPSSDLAGDRKTSARTGVLVAYSSQPHDQEIRESKVRLFEQASLRLLHFCNPDSSAYTWFTWHSIQCLVAAVRLAALGTYSRQAKPVHRHRTMMAQQANSAEGSRRKSDLLRRALDYLKKMQIVRTDSRGEGFRWYLNMPWSALAIAIVECNICADMALLNRAWPLVQEWYQVYESSGDMVFSAELVTLMQQMQATFQGHHGSQQPSGGQSIQTPSGYSVANLTSTVLLATGLDCGEAPSTSTEPHISLTDFENGFKPDSNPSTHLLSPVVWDVSSYI